VVIAHSHGKRTLYAHLLDRHGNVGDQVELGEIIGYVGKTGRATGPHLHLEVQEDDVAIDPFLVMTQTLEHLRIGGKEL